MTIYILALFLTDVVIAITVGLMILIVTYKATTLFSPHKPLHPFSNISKCGLEDK